jgi:hypothetical protein
VCGAQLKILALQDFASLFSPIPQVSHTSLSYMTMSVPQVLILGVLDQLDIYSFIPKICICLLTMPQILFLTLRIQQQTKLTKCACPCGAEMIGI